VVPRFQVIEAICLVLITAVGLQMEVCNDLHLLREHLYDVTLEKRVADLLNPC